RIGTRHHARARPPARVARPARATHRRAGSRALPALIKRTRERRLNRYGERVGPFVDCHSHVVPSGDDGAATIEDGAALCRSAAEHGTALLFATPHVWPYFELTPQREQEIREAFDRLRPRAGLELRLGFEL